MVQTMKRSLRKFLLNGDGKDWVKLLPCIAMSYQMSKPKVVEIQSSLLMFGSDPVFVEPVAVFKGGKVGLYCL